MYFRSTSIELGTLFLLSLEESVRSSLAICVPVSYQIYQPMKAHVFFFKQSRLSDTEPEQYHINKRQP